VGNGFIASRDGGLRPEFILKPDDPTASLRFDLPTGAIMKKYDANGSLTEKFQLTRGVDQQQRPIDEWVPVP
jgi:hypothetical protein